MSIAECTIATKTGVEMALPNRSSKKVDTMLWSAVWRIGLMGGRVRGVRRRH